MTHYRGARMLQRVGKLACCLLAVLPEQLENSAATILHRSGRAESVWGKELGKKVEKDYRYHPNAGTVQANDSRYRDVRR